MRYFLNLTTRISARITKRFSKQWQIHQQLWQQQPCAICERICLQTICVTCLQTYFSHAQKQHTYYCPRCAQPSEQAEGVCHRCLRAPPHYQALYFIDDYQHFLRDWIINAKHGRQLASIHNLLFLAENYAKTHAPPSTQLTQNTENTNADFHLLAMPISRFRLMRRGYNLPDWISKVLAKTWQLKRLPPFTLRLPFYVQKQTRKTRAERLLHQPDIRIMRPLPKKILLVDDVITTGQTSNYIARLLKQHGAEEVHLFVLARTQSHFARKNDYT